MIGWKRMSQELAKLTILIGGLRCYWGSPLLFSRGHQPAVWLRWVPPTLRGP